MDTMDKMDTIDTKENINEFITIIELLVDKDLAVLHQVLIFNDETEQIQCLRKLRCYIEFYPNLYNAYTARVLVEKPITYVKKEIESRFNKLYLGDLHNNK